MQIIDSIANTTNYFLKGIKYLHKFFQKLLITPILEHVLGKWFNKTTPLPI